MQKIPSFAAGVVALAFMVSGCGPARSSASLMRARSAISRAETAGAEQEHRYELAKARAYYDKAREEAGYSKYEVATDLARQAEKLAKVASGELSPDVLKEEPKGKKGKKDKADKKADKKASSDSKEPK